jgi:hypothetical protein
MRLRPNCGMCARSRPALAMHKHTASAAACSAVLRIANGRGVLNARALSCRYLKSDQPPFWSGPSGDQDGVI